MAPHAFYLGSSLAPPFPSGRDTARQPSLLSWHFPSALPGKAAVLGARKPAFVSSERENCHLCAHCHDSRSSTSEGEWVPESKGCQINK